MNIYVNTLNESMAVDDAMGHGFVLWNAKVVGSNPGNKKYI